MNVLNPYVRQFLVGWITVLDSVPDIDMLGFLPDFLDGQCPYIKCKESCVVECLFAESLWSYFDWSTAGLFNMLSDNSHEIRQQADSALSEFLQEIKNSPVRLLPHVDCYTVEYQRTFYIGILEELHYFIIPNVK